MLLNKDDHKLDNPAWYSLSESHTNFSVDYGGIKFYHPDYCPFGGFEAGNSIAEHIDAYSAMVDDFFVVGEKPALSTHVQLKKELVCLQMVCPGSINEVITDTITILTHEHAAALSQLINLVQPGYFKPKTALLGNYYGIFKNGKLIAVSGERMRMHDFVEVSAIVTHPDHTGQGYAKQLIAHTVNNITDQHKTAYLHVVETNTGAIKLYEKLGFTTRRKISFWNISV
jgi:ribosomal protein S18 acetylase RimI-like enzyme